jgi:hypothetical protein
MNHLARPELEEIGVGHHGIGEGEPIIHVKRLDRKLQKMMLASIVFALSLRTINLHCMMQKDMP